MRQRPGFSLIELLTVMGVAAILVAIGFPAVQSMRQNSSLNGGTQDVVSVLRLAQSQAIAGKGNVDQTIDFIDASSYSYQSTTYLLPSGVTFSPVPGDITFLRKVGSTTSTTITINGSSNTKQISVGPTGLVSLQ